MKNYEIEINGETYRVKVKELAADADMSTNDQPAAPAAAESTPAASSAPAAGTGAEVKAPMPGTILSVKVSAGQNVAQGDVLAILEAMKMENEIIAPADGVVSEIMVNANDSVEADQVLFVL